MYARYIKRLLDIICSLAALILFCWLYAIIAILVYVKLGSPVLFTQERPGKDEKIFKIYKFRTMTDARDENGELLLDAERLTKFGKALRATSMDELPEVFNILKGDMSIIG
ncbi:MAG: sugar transferase, partial [Lachnospiraceae bacterium]|nr:sugar transferase [Lachnospiraceae bacterium]